MSTILPRPDLPQANNPPVVLVVEDDVLIRTSAAEYLRASGYKTVEATTAAEAVDVINSGAPVDVVFTDVRMPGGMDGVELAGWVRAPPSRRPPPAHLRRCPGGGLWLVGRVSAEAV